MSFKDNLGDRMKRYEASYQITLPRRLPVILRLDGKAFHSYTRPLKEKNKPFDKKMVEVMNRTAIKLCREIQGVEIAYVQSDEISLLLHNYKRLNSQPWYNNEIQKMVSVSAAIASATFSVNSWEIWSHKNFDLLDEFPDIRPAYFDSRAFVLPPSEVCNYFLWRQNDCVRNSVQSLARSLYSHKECINKNNTELQEMCFEAGRNWNNEPVSFRRGRCITKTEYGWCVDDNIPIFSQDRDYINYLLEVEES